MKKLLLLLLISTLAFNAYAELNRINFKWSKVISFDRIALSEKDVNDGKIGIIDKGKVLISYKDFGSAGSLCSISIDAGKEFKGTSFDGSKVIQLEDVQVYYDPVKETLIIQDKFGENLMFIISNGDLKLLVFYDIIPFLVR